MSKKSEQKDNKGVFTPLTGPPVPKPKIAATRPVVRPTIQFQ